MKDMRLSVLAVIIFAWGAFIPLAQAQQDSDTDPKPIMTPEMLKRSAYEGSVFHLLEWSDRHTLFVTGLKATGLDAELHENRSWTVFAPTDAAFARLPRETVTDLFSPEKRDVLRHILSYHIQSDGMLVTDSLPLGVSRYGTFNGQDIVITRDFRGTLFNGIYMVETDIPARNGIVHFIERLILPPQ